MHIRFYMDSNVSKNTNSHNFFKLVIDRQNLCISVKNLLKQELLLILDLYQRKYNVEIEHKLATNILEDKIVLANRKKRSIETAENVEMTIHIEQSALIIYACPIGFCLSRILQEAPSIIVRRLRILGSEFVNTENQLKIGLQVETVASGWINFQLNARFLGLWLEKLLSPERSLSLDTTTNVSSQTSDNLFPAQYIHARCCSLLRLAARENLVSLSQTLHIEQKISWLDRLGSMWCDEPAEIILLQQLLKIADSWVEGASDRQWFTLALGLSQTTAVFLAECRFLGEVKQRCPQKAIARLGLISLVQIWLRKILIEKLNIAAPQEL